MEVGERSCLSCAPTGGGCVTSACLAGAGFTPDEAVDPLVVPIVAETTMQVSVFSMPGTGATHLW